MHNADLLVLILVAIKLGRLLKFDPDFYSGCAEAT